MRRKGFSLIELLVVVAIIILIAALLFPIIMSIRKRGYEPTCLAHLRQLHAAFAGYLQDYEAEAEYQRQLWPYVTDKRIWVCPADTTDEGAATLESNSPLIAPSQRTKTSYLYYGDAFYYSDSAKNQLRDKDPSHGIFVCYMHGVPVEGSVIFPRHDMKGKVLRLRRDGSVQHAYPEHTCLARDGAVYGYRLAWQLFTDVRPMPDEVIREHPLLGNGQLVECPQGYR